MRLVVSRRTCLVALAALSVALPVLAACGGGEEREEASEADADAFSEGKRYDAVVRTSHGSFTIRLDTERAPKTTASFIRLARDEFFDGTVFHRIVPGFVIQGGDPTGTGTGGPGSTVVEPPPQDLRYTKGVVAMAKAGDEPAGASGSQFFVVTAADAGLPPEYALLGKVSEGLGVVQKIGRLGDPATEQPTEKVTVERITIRER